MIIKYYFLKACQKVFSQPIICSSRISKKAAIWNDCLIIGSKIEDYSYVSDHTNIYFTKIGKFCSIAQYCTIGGAAHPTGYVSTSPVFLAGRNAFRTNLSNLSFEPYKETLIGHDVWIGAHSCIRSGVKIADGAVIGMGSVLVKDVGPYEIWAGNPARMIRKRFDEETIEEILKSEWWNFSEEEIRLFGDKEDNPKAFLDAVKEGRKGC